MEMVGRARVAVTDLLLRPLRIRQHHGARAGDVHAVPDRRHAGRGAAFPCRRAAGLFLKPLRRADPLRHDARTDLFRRRLRLAAKMVAVGVDRIRGQYSDLGFGGAGLVEDSGMVVSCGWPARRGYIRRGGRVAARSMTDGEWLTTGDLILTLH